MIPSVDAHQHFWMYRSEEYDWIDDSMSALRRDFVPADWSDDAKPSGVIASVAVQARQSVEETRWLLQLAADAPAIAGVIGWADLRSSEFAVELEELAASTRLVGLRHVIQNEPAGFMERAAFNESIARLAPAGLVFDLLIRDHQLAEATRLVDRHPNQPFVLDHAAKPRIADRLLEPWRAQIVELARRPNVCCKISGVVTEANVETWSLADLRPYLDTLVDAFGSDRLMAGSDWPVCLVATSFQRWWSTLLEYFAHFSEAEQQAVFRTTAERAYALTVPA